MIDGDNDRDEDRDKDQGRTKIGTKIELDSRALRGGVMIGT